jgi:hypothetical protein
METVSKQQKELQGVYQTPDVAVVFAGDLNSLPASAVYKLLSTGSFTSETGLQPSSKLQVDHDLAKLGRYVNTLCFTAFCVN